MTPPIQINYKSVDNALNQIARPTEGLFAGKPVIVCKKNGDNEILEGEFLSLFKRIVLIIEKIFGINDEKSLTGQMKKGFTKLKEITDLLVLNQTNAEIAIRNLYLHQQQNLKNQKFSSREEAFLAVLYLAEHVQNGLPRYDYGTQKIPKIVKNEAGQFQLNFERGPDFSLRDMKNTFIFKYRVDEKRYTRIRKLTSGMDQKFFGGEKVLQGTHFIGSRVEELESKIAELESNENTCPELIKQRKKELAVERTQQRIS
jgi:hypothetical protein